VISVDTTLSSDLADCSGTGLTVEASANLDLNGHTIRGTGSGVGLLIQGTASGGTVRGFAVGVGATGTSAAVDHMTVRNNGVGVSTAAGARVVSNVITSNSSHGMQVGGELLVGTIADNVIIDNGGDGISAVRATATYEDNLIAKNAGAGIRLEESVSSVRRNTIRANGGDGLYLRDGCFGSGPIWIGLYRVGGNDLDRNGALGINLVPRTTCFEPGVDLAALISMVDEGGNSANNNGDQRQCVYIVCTKN